MTKQVSQNRRYYLSEFTLYDGDHFITFNIVDIDTDGNMITVAVTDEGRISVRSFDLISDGDGLYFEYGVNYEKIAVDDFERFNDGEGGNDGDGE